MPAVRNPQDLAAGLALIALALLAFWLGADLEVGRAMKMGPGYLPRVLAVLIGLNGVMLAVGALVVPGPRLERWSMGRLALVLLAIVLFAFGIRPFGLVATGAALMVVASLAARDFRWIEIVVFTAAMVAFASLLFVVALGLPLPLWPGGLR